MYIELCIELRVETVHLLCIKQCDSCLYMCSIFEYVCSESTLTMADLPDVPSKSATAKEKQLMQNFKVVGIALSVCVWCMCSNWLSLGCAVVACIV